MSFRHTREEKATLDVVDVDVVTLAVVPVVVVVVIWASGSGHFHVFSPCCLTVSDRSFDGYLARKWQLCQKKPLKKLLSTTTEKKGLFFSSRGQEK